MQGFFFAIDVAIVFAHALPPKIYDSLLNYAIRFLEATRPSHGL